MYSGDDEAARTKVLLKKCAVELFYLSGVLRAIAARGIHAKCYLEDAAACIKLANACVVAGVPAEGGPVQMDGAPASVADAVPAEVGR
jgi:hypothetical protein